jgi:hypothetical protein
MSDAAMSIGSNHLRRRELPTSLALGVLLAGFSVAPLVQGAQEQPPLIRLNGSGGLTAQPVFRAETKLVTLTFAFRPSAEQKRLKTRNAPDLRAEDIEILDNGIPQRLAVLKRAGTEETKLPTDVILLFDCGKCFRPYINPRDINLNLHLLDELQNVRISVYGFSDSAYRLIRPTRDVAQLTAAMANLSRIPNIQSIVPDAIVQTIQDAMTIPGSQPRMMVVFTGAACDCRTPPQRPRYDYAQVVGLAMEHDIELFSVLVQPPPPALPPSFPATRGAPDPLSMPRSVYPTSLGIGEATGGKDFSGYAVSEEVLQEVFRYVRSQVKSEYVAGFYRGAPSSAGGASHRIEVRLKSNIGEISGGVRAAVY